MERYLSPAEVCELIPGMTVEKLKYLRRQGSGPRFIKASAKTIVYSATEIERYMRSREQVRTGEDLVAA